jgi:hypothetical protein
MVSDLKDERQLKLLTTDELKRLWVEACKSWAPTSDVEPLDVADVEAELDLRHEGLPFHLVREELAMLAGCRILCFFVRRQASECAVGSNPRRRSRSR